MTLVEQFFGYRFGGCGGLHSRSRYGGCRHNEGHLGSAGSIRLVRAAGGVGEEGYAKIPADLFYASNAIHEIFGNIVGLFRDRQVYHQVHDFSAPGLVVDFAQDEGKHAEHTRANHDHGYISLFPRFVTQYGKCATTSFIKLAKTNDKKRASELGSTFLCHSNHHSQAGSPSRGAVAPSSSGIESGPANQIHLSEPVLFGPLSLPPARSADKAAGTHSHSLPTVSSRTSAADRAEMCPLPSPRPNQQVSP